MAIENHIETVIPRLPPASGYEFGCGPHIDGSIVKFWPTKREAISAAKAIRWTAANVTKVHTRFCIGYAIRERWGDGGFITRAGYADALRRWEVPADGDAAE